MFNVGVLAARKKSAGPVLTDSFLWGEYLSEQENMFALVMTQNGLLGFRQSNTIYVPNEWFSGGPTANIGAQYRWRYYRESGDQNLLSATGQSLAQGQWLAFSAYPFVYLVAPAFGTAYGARIRVEIADLATLTVRASGRFWTPGFAP